MNVTPVDVSVYSSFNFLLLLFIPLIFNNPILLNAINSAISIATIIVVIMI